jgi:hypothetical protein
VVLKNCKLKRKYPSACYSDKYGVFHQNNPKTSAGDSLTDFARAMQEIGVGIICANTPQAKGRVERANKTLQDWLTKERRLQNISTMHEANLWLPKFMEDCNQRFDNQRFATVPRSEHDFHEPLTDSNILDHILCRKVTRTLSRNRTLRRHKRVYQTYVAQPGSAQYLQSLYPCPRPSLGKIQP